MIPLRYPFQSYSHRFVGIDNANILGLVFPKTAASFTRGNLLVFYQALLLASEFPTFYDRFPFHVWNFSSSRTCLALSSFGFSIAHFCFALRFDASHICSHISGHTLSGLEVVCFLVTLLPDHVYPSGGLPFKKMNLVNPGYASDSSRSPSTLE